MSDFFMSNQDKNELQSAAQIRNDIQKKDQEDIEAFKQKKQERLENWNRYGVDVPDEYYNVFNQIISKAPTPEEAQEEAYKIGSAVKYSRMMNMPLEEAYKNVDSFNEAMFTDLQGQKSRYEALSDMFTLGTNNVKLGRLGQELMQAHGRNDTELANKLMAEIDALNQQNVLMQDNAPRTWVMEALEAGAQSLPFTGVVAGAGIIGNFIAPAVGTGASFAASSYLASGQEYIDMLANGASPETARLVATVSGGIQGLIEADLGISKSIVKGTARIIGKEAAEKAAKKSVEEIGRKVFKRFHFGAGKKVLINYLENRGKDILGEGTEEFLQEITSIVGQEVAAGLDGYDIPDDDINSIVKQTTEAFRGGVLGALSMGFIPAGINAAADVKEYKLIKDTAEIFESEEMFKEVAKDSPVFEGMSDEQKAQTIHDVWQNAQNRKEEAANIEAQKIAEGRDAAEGAEEAPAENEDGTTEVNPVARDERGRLYTSDDVSTDDAGNVTGGTFVIGDKTKSENNRYGYINYKTDENGDITIENFKMTEGREGLRAEAFDDFARQHPDVRIDWNAIGSDMQEQKQALIDANPSGAKNGLSYYSTSELDNVAARKQVAEEVRKNIHNVKRNADGSYTRTELSNKQVAAAVTLIESAARRMGMGLNEYVSKTFGSQIIGSREEFASASLAQGEDVNKKAGGMFQGVAQNNWREVGQQVKAVIYAGENADFSTWAHEMAHVFQNQLDGDLKNEAEAAFNVVGGDWINSTYTFSDGRTLSSAEAFAYGFQDWLETGKAESEQMKNIFQKFAEFIADAYNRLKNHLNFTPEIVDVFNKLLDGDDTIMSKALKAAQEQDNEYRANLKRQAEEKQASREAEKEQAKKQAEAEREEAREGTDFTEAAPTAEELLNGIEEAENETEKTDNAIDNALENTNLTDEEKGRVADVLKDESSTVVEKAEATTEAAESAYDDEAPIDLFQTDAGQQLLSQLAGEPSIRRMAEKEERERILAELDAAQLFDEKYKSMDANSRAARIRRATGWEKDAKGEWKYEFDDSVNRIKTEFFKANPGILSGSPYLLNLGDILEADELYRVFPYMQNVRVSFYSDPNAFRAVLTPQGIKVNTRYLQGMNGETGLKGVLAHEIQHIIQAMEFADSKGLQGKDIEQLYNDVMKAMQAAGERKYNYDLTSLQQGLDAYMQDAGEIEARNVARRILMNADQRRMNTLASTEDVKRQPKLLFQAVKNEIKADEMEGLKEITDNEFEKIADNLYSDPIDYKSIPNLVLLPNVNESLKKELGIKGNLYITKNRFTHTNPKRKHAHGEQDFTLDEYKSIPKMIRNATYALQENNSKYNSFFITELDKQDNTKVNVIIFDEDKNGNLLTTIKKLPLTDLRSGSYKIVGTGVEPAISHTVRVSPTTLASSPNESNIAQEIEAVKQKYQNTDKWLKAPNGEDSNLDEKQWVQVRTPSFKKWFGDWENEPANASKVLDENGEPLVVYHGTDADFTIFDASKSRANMDIQGNFFSPWDIDAQGYGPNVRAFYLNIRNPANSSQGYSSLNTFKGQNEAGIKARELLKSKGFDGVNNDNEEYITFEPNQIKSATDNNGNFDAKNPDILFQIAGEIGAENLDNSEVQEGVSRMQNLAIAKQMDAEKKDAQAIRLATGWEKGGDGKWKYEIDDSKIKTDFEDKSYLFRIRNPRYGELEKKLKSLNYDWEKLSKEEQEEFDKLGDLYNENLERNEVVLMEILDAPELFRAYPQLREMPVTFKTRDYSQNYEAHLVNGYYVDDNSPYFAIEFNGTPNSYNSESFKSTLLHEIQHAIQRIEGFGRGGNLEEAAELIEKDNQKKAEIKSKAFAWEWKIELEKQEEKYPELKGNLALMNSLMDEYTENGKYPIKELEDEHWIPERDIRDKGFNLYVRGYDKEGFEEAYKEWQEKAGKKGVTVFNPTKDTERNRFNYYKRFAGEIESRNVQTRMNFTPEQRLNTLLAATEDVAPEDRIILFQEVYHGSGADFDKFDTEQYGLSGEGSMSFGYGTYLTDSEDIAREYARRQGKTVITLDGKEWQPEKNNFYETLIYSNLTAGKTLEDIKEWANSIKYPDRKSLLLDTIKKVEDKGLKVEGYNRHLYTVKIPDDGYLEWNKHISKDDVKNIVSKFVDFMLAQPSKNETKIHEVEDVDSWYWDDITGHGLYETLEVASSNRPQLVSQFLHSIGYAGIKYPAGTIHGNGNGAYNYVIFNDDDAKIVDKLLFQTNAELMDEAKSFENWQDFMEYCETFHADDEVSPIPSDADAQWYQTYWETSHGVEVEAEKNEQEVKTKNENDSMNPIAVDALFSTFIKSYPEMIDNFLQAVAEIDAIDLDSEEWQQAENAEDAAQREQIEKLKDFIAITLSDYNWQTALRRIQGGHEIAEGLRKRLIGEMTDNFKTRDFRALYAEIMNDEQYAVAPEDSVTAMLNKKLKKYHDIVKPNDDISKWSPERRKQLAEQLANKEIAAKIRNGSLKLDDELDAYIKSLNKQIKETQDQYNELEKETKADYQRIADKERRDLLKLHEQLLLARGKLNSRNTEVNRKIAKGLKITEKYSRMTQNLNANYDEIFRKYNDLRNSITINSEVQAALDRQVQVAGLKEDLNAKQKEKNLTAEVKKMRIQLVKRTMRRVPFNRIDYENAKTVIAIQRMLEPNLLGGVNRFIGIDSPYLRGVISQIVTDSDYKEKIMNYLSKNTKASQAFADFKKKLEELKSIKDFDSWTAKERKAAIRYLPKENWVRDLNLKELAKEREESIDLDIGMEEVKRTVYDEKTGEPKTYKDKEGNTYNVTETAFKLKYDDELGRLVQDAVGADMFDKIVNMPFSEWTTEDLEGLAQRIDELYIEGRDLKAAKDEARKRNADSIRRRIEDAVKETGITINDDDTPEEKERKEKQNNKIMGYSSDLKGTEAGKDKGFMAKITRLLHSYSDMNVLRFARMLDGQSEGENVRMLYRKEDDCYNAKQRSMNSRADKIYKVMQKNGITEGDLAEVVKVPSLGTEFTVDELLYFLAADKDYAEDEKKLQRGLFGIDANDDYAATSRNAVMFGNMMSDMMSQEEKESWLKLDKDMEEALQNDTLTQEQKEQLATGQLDKKPGTTRYIGYCHAKWEAVLGAANNYLSTHPEYKALMEAIEADYASQYERMNEISINEFNMPVHRVKAYVPLVRRESNGDTNENKVKEDLLGAAGVGKQWADRGMTQRRVNISPLNQKPVQTGLFRTWADSIERTEHFIAYAPYVRQLNAVYKSRDASYTRRFIESRYGAGAIKYLDEYINEVANPNAGRIRERGAEWLHVLRGKTAPAYLGWKASAIIKQGLTSPWPYMQFVNPVEYMAAAMKFTFNPEMREAIKEKSVFMKMRRMDPVNDLIDEMADNAKTKLDRGWSNFSKLGMQGLEMIDWACVAPGWLACYEKKYNQLQNASNARYEAKMAELKERNIYAEVGTSEYLTPQQMEAEARKEMAEDIEAEAVRYADDCTRQCQPSNRVTDLAPLFKNSSEAMKAFLQFQTSLNVIWQNLRYDMPYAVKNKEFTRIAGTVIGYVCAGIFMNSVMDGISGDDDDDDTQALRNLIYYSTTQFTDAIPIMGSEITNTMDQLITGKRGFISSGTDMTPSATKLLSVLTTAKKGNWQKAAELTAEGIGLYLGAPVSGVKEINKLLGKPLKEGDVNLARGIGDVYGIAGDILEE